MRYVALVLSLAFVACAVAADTPAGEPAKPKSPQAVAAIRKHDKAVGDADAVYRKAQLTAERTLLDELKTAEATALKGGGPAALAEGNAIEAEIQVAKARVTSLTGNTGTGVARPAGPANVLSAMHVVRCKATTGGDGVELRGDGLLESDADYPTPVKIDFVAKTNGADVRLYYGRGQFILNWAGNPRDLRYQDPATQEIRGTNADGEIPREKWVHLTWVIGDQQTALLVEGQQRFAIAGNFKGFAGKIGIGPMAGSVVTVKSVTATAQ